ncbi:MAG TPA: FtsX-like permease family protein [Bacillota bacterium]|nr:FtsX-like permease family protein [Bacillota bacterium]
MKFVDAYILAATKRKTRRIRTSLVVIVSSLLFAILFFAALTAQGLFSTANQVKNVGFNGRNMAMVYTGGAPSYDYKAVSEGIKATMDTELRSRGIKVTENTQLDPSYVGEYTRRLIAVTAQYQIADQQKLEATVQKAKPTALYRFAALPISGSTTFRPTPADDTYITKLQEAAESGGAGSQGPGGFDPGNDFQFFQVEKGMLLSQLQPGQTVAWQPGKPFPLFISYAYLEKLSGKSFSKLSTAARNQGYRDLMKAYAGKTIEYCYRNSTAQTYAQQVVTYNYKAAHDNDKDTSPINVPACADFDTALLKKIKIIADDGTVADDTAKPLFSAPALPVASTRVLQFKIAGFVPSSSQYGGGDIVTQVLTSVSQLPAGSQLGIIPTEVVAAAPELQAKDEGGGGFELYGQGYSTLLVDFAARSQEKAFIASGCTGSECGNPKNTKPYITPFGSVSFALEGLFHAAFKFLVIGVGVVMFIAALLLMFTISKVIADSTKEIAVFRSLGARRRDIAQIYYLYGLMLAAASLVLSVVLAVAGAKVVTNMFAPRIAGAFIKTTGAYNTDVHASLLGINWLWFGGAAAALLLAALIGITIPILISLRRKLITILREE